jgi:hypothetical protein
MENLAGLSKQNSFLLKKVPCHARIQILLLFSKKNVTQTVWTAFCSPNKTQSELSSETDKGESI